MRLSAFSDGAAIPRCFTCDGMRESRAESPAFARMPEATSEITLEPLHRAYDDAFQGARLREQVARARDDLKRLRLGQARIGPLIELDDAKVHTAYDEERRRTDPTKRVTGEVRAPPTGNDGANAIAQFGRGDQGSGGSGARAKQA